MYLTVLLWEFHELMYLMWVLLQSHYIRSHLGSPIYNVTAQYSVMLATVLFIRGDWNAKVGSQEIPGVPGKFGLGGQNETRQRPTEFCQEHALVIANTLFQQHKDNSTNGHHQTVNTEIRLYSLQPNVEKLNTVSKNKTRSWLWLRPWTPYFKIQA